MTSPQMNGRNFSQEMALAELRRLSCEAQGAPSIAAAKSMEEHMTGRNWTFAIPTSHTRRVFLTEVIAGSVPEALRTHPLPNGFYVWLEYWDTNWCRWMLVKGSISGPYSAHEEALAYACTVWDEERHS